MNNDQKSELNNYATFGDRLYAFVVDNAIFFPLSLLDTYNLAVWKIPYIPFLTIAIWCIYKPFMEWKYGATFGKKVAKIKVVNSENQGISFNQAMLRFTPYFAFNVVTLLNTYNLFLHPKFAETTVAKELLTLQADNPNPSVSIVFFIFSFSLLGIFYNDKKQTHHDRLAQTYCIKNR